MGFRVEVDINENFNDEMIKDIAKATKIVMNDIETEAQNLAPVDTGFLRRSIKNVVRVYREKEKITARLYANAEYAGFVHEGTKYQKPQKFLSDAIDEKRITTLFSALMK